MQMKLRFPESEIKIWASRYDYPREEIELINLCSNIQRVGYISKNELCLIAQWKSSQSAGHIEKNYEKLGLLIKGVKFVNGIEQERHAA